MIPISDSVRTRSVPYVNLAIIVLNLLVFLYEVYLSQDVVRGNVTELDLFIYEWGNVPACTFDELGRNAALSAEGRAICGEQSQPLLTMITATFIHGGWLHIGGNMLFLWIFGDNVEDTMGHLRYLVFYLLCGVLAGLVHGVTDIDSLQPAVGASGAIAGVMGAYIVLFPRAVVYVIFGFIFIPLPLPAFVLIGIWIVIQVFFGWASLGVDTASGGVAYFAHIGGFVAGAALVHAFILGRKRPRRSTGRAREYW
ncbi:MAG: rhomboid family intramembrane serine protease [Dehalococcoidia bacterium]